MKLTPEQLKGKIRAYSSKKSLHAQEVLQMFMFERLLSRIEKSNYRDNIIIKGGVLIASMIGVDARTTMDLDTTVKGIKITKENIKSIITEIINIDVNDSITFTYDSISEIKDDDQYENYRVHLIATLGKIRIPLKIDITTGDAITPSEIDFSYPKMFEEGKILIKAYPLETVLAEKYETILHRNISTTRAKDFYDVYILYRTKRSFINVDNFRKAVINTATRRDSLNDIMDNRSIIEDIDNDNSLRLLWDNYLNENKYISAITFSEIILCLYEITEALNIKD